MKKLLQANIQRQIKKHLANATWTGKWWKQWGNLVDTAQRLGLPL